MRSEELLLTIVRASDTVHVPVGSTHVVGGPTRIGRHPASDLVVADPTVSREHAHLFAGDDGWRVANLTRANGVFVDGQPIPPGAEAGLGDDATNLQIGGVVFRVSRFAATRPVVEPVPADGVDRVAGAATFEMTRDGDRVDVRCAGRLVAIKPLTSVVFFALASQAGRSMHAWDLTDEVGRAFHLPQAISDLRRVVRRLLVDGWLDRGTVRDAVAAVGDAGLLDGLAFDDDAALARQVVRSQRGHGYALLLPADWFELSRAG